ncbi:MAG: MCE family protein [Verrucomicrobiae bacterium]|nr:MCE family protein [Verrucomicrobiae bacterium]
MEEKSDRTEFYVGLFVFFGLVLLGTLILAFGGIGKLFRKTYELSVKFDNVQSLREGAPVIRGGLSIGYVSTMPTLVGFDKVQVPLAIYDEFKIPTGAQFKIGTAGLMGDTFVAVLPPEVPSETPGDVVPGDALSGTTSTGFGELSDETIVVLRKIQKGLDDLNHSLAKVDDDILSSDNIENIKTSIASLNSTAIKFQEQYINDVNAENINETLTSLKTTVQMLSEIVDTLPPLIKETTDTVKSIGPSVEDFTNEAKETAESFQSLAKSLEALSNDVRDSEGAVPMLLHDPQVREDVKAIIFNIRKHGILFYKDSFSPSVDGIEPESETDRDRRGLFQKMRDLNSKSTDR